MAKTSSIPIYKVLLYFVKIIGEPEIVDQLIVALGLGSGGQDYTPITLNSTESSTSHQRRSADCEPSRPREPPEQVCLEHTVPHESELSLELICDMNACIMHNG